MQRTKSEESFDIDTLSDIEYDTEGSGFHTRDGMLVIGIDFGTTFSGAAWATLADFMANQVHLITRWPGMGEEQGKVPTELFYENDEVIWGYDVPADSDPVRWFKLLLLKDEDLDSDLRSCEYILRGRRMLRENEKTAVDLVVDYLRGFWEHVLSEIIKARGSSLIDALRFHVVITLPAIWKGYARKSMQEAVFRAGILSQRDAGDTTLSFVPEPEAAALYTLCEPGRQVNPGDVYIICDAGGGTVDLITYEIEGVDPLALREAAEGIGGLCGGIFIDEVFESICKNRLGRIWGCLNKIDIQEVMDTWQRKIKSQFRATNSNKEYYVPIPAQAFPDKESQTDTSRQPIIKDGRIYFKEADVQKAFTKAISDIEKLIDNQISLGKDRNIPITGIILVGGLGSSPYLYDTLKAKYENQQISILQSSGMGPRTAISRGAIYKGFLDSHANRDEDDQASLDTLRAIITSTISRANFGIRFRTPFVEGEHLETDKTWDDIEEVWMVDNEMHWYLKKGDDVSKSNPVRAKWYRAYTESFDKTLSENIYQCTDQMPPSQITSGVTTLCNIKWTPDVSFEELEWMTNDSGKEYKKLEYEIEFIPLGATAEFAIYIDGRKQKGKGLTVNIQYSS
ncbi:actin-like ATPase domain-containing protein [Hypoxylon sp. EC38]|nr:actin-like ATPase domain-containing protein [Hypoxylon sp. EC38]